MSEIAVLMLVEAGEAGLGHAGRSVALAEAMRDKMWDLRIVVQGHDGGIFRQRGFVTELSIPVGAWDVVVIDQREARTVFESHDWGDVPVIAIDQDAELGVDLHIRPPTSRYLEARSERTLDGVEYALVRSEFRTLGLGPRFRGPVVVSFGGVDPQDISESVAEELDRLNVPIRETAQRNVGRASMSEVLDGASVAVMAFGHSIIEAATCGVPVVFVSWIHQDPRDARAFQRWGTAHYVGEARMPDVSASLASAAQELRSDERLWAAMSEAGLRRFDGLGAHRVVQVIENLIQARRR